MSRLNKYLRWLSQGVFVVVLLACVSCSQATQSTSSQQISSTTAKTTLPGQQIWKGGISSFLFGTNDTQEWAKNNVETNTGIQTALKDAHFTLMRTFFFDKSLADGHATTDTEIEQRLKTVENSGMICLGVLHSISNIAFDEHVVAYAGSRCQMYEFGNESDYNGVSIQSYLQQWNTVIPILRKINPNAKFIGPVTYNDQGNHDFMQGFLNGVKASGVLPDAISFHWYPCYQDTEESCLKKASTYGQVAQGVRSLVHSILGKDLPIGITEWNYDPGNPPPAYGNDPKFISQFTSAALQSMAQAGVAFACQFDVASYSGYGQLDMFNLDTNQPKAQFNAMKAFIANMLPSSTVTAQPQATPSQTATPSTGEDAGPLISRGRPVYCSSNNQGPGGPPAIVNGHYGDWSFWRTDLSSLPGWCAIHLAPGPTRVLLTWENDNVFDYISDTGMGPQDYTISVSSNSTNGADGTWQTVVSVVGNHTRIREHLLPFAGQSWVKMTVTKGQPQASQPYLVINQIDIYDVSNSLNDTFFFSGDSITVMAYNRFDENQPSYSVDVHKAYPQYFPVTLDGGFGGWDSSGAVQDMDSWLALNPDIKYWLLGWGTNDALEQVSPKNFQANLQMLVDKIEKAGHIPVIAHIPYMNKGAAVDQEVQALNLVIDQVTAANGLIAGPDFYQLFKSNATAYLLPDGIHPTPAGAIAMNQAWFETLRASLYS